MASQCPVPSWCLVCCKLYDPQYTLGHGYNIATILCFPGSLPKFPSDHQREGHAGIYVHNPEPSDVFRRRNIDVASHLTGSSFEEDELKSTPIQFSKRFEEFNFVKSPAVLEALELVPQVTSQFLEFSLNRWSVCAVALLPMHHIKHFQAYLFHLVPWYSQFLCWETS